MPHVAATAGDASRELHCCLEQKIEDHDVRLEGHLVPLEHLTWRSTDCDRQDDRDGGEPSGIGTCVIVNRWCQVPLFVVGSSTSRSQSPTMLMDSVVKKIVHPGTPAIHHAFSR